MEDDVEITSEESVEECSLEVVSVQEFEPKCVYDFVHECYDLL